MKPTIRSRALGASIALATLLVATSAMAVPIDRGATIERDDQVWTVAGDGTWTMERQLEIRVNEARLVPTLAQQGFPYNATLETLDIVDAYTEKPDGRRIDVARDRIREVQAPSSPEVAMFEDVRAKVAIFPQVAAGDRLVMHVRQRRTRTELAGQFEHLAVPQPYPIREARIVVDLPAALPLYADARGYRSAPPTTSGDRRRYAYEYVDHPRDQPDPFGVAATDDGDRLAVSTMRDYAALAAVYRRGAAGKTTVTPAVRALASTITAGVEGRRAQALALGDWVRRNIRYVAVYVGDGGVVPHTADEILAARYGDCKDHAALLEALLDAAGIPSTTALISAGNAYELTSVPVLGILNHVITYVPELQLFIDATAANVTAGYLPFGDQGKTVVLVNTGATMRTPSSQPDSVTVETWFSIDASGAEHFRQIRTMRGAAAEAGRARSRNGGNETGTGIDVDAGDVEGRSDEYVLRMTGTQAFPPGAVHALTGVRPLDPLYMAFMSDLSLLHSTGNRNYPCAAHDIEHTAHIQVPHGYAVSALPEPLALHEAGVDYAMQITREEGEIIVTRRYHDHPATNVCTPADAVARNLLRTQVMNDLMAGNVVLKAQ